MKKASITRVPPVRLARSGQDATAGPASACTRPTWAAPRRSCRGRPATGTALRVEPIYAEVVNCLTRVPVAVKANPHLAARNSRMHQREVRSSNPLCSTKKSPRAVAVSLLLKSYNFIRDRAFRARSAAPCAASRRRDRRRASPARVRGDAARAAPMDRPQRRGRPWESPVHRRLDDVRSKESEGKTHARRSFADAFSGGDRLDPDDLAGEYFVEPSPPLGDGA